MKKEYKSIPILRPSLPTTRQLQPYLQSIDVNRLYTNYGPLVLQLEDRLSGFLELPSGGLISASSGTSALVGAILAQAGRASAEKPLALIPAFTFVATAVAAEQCGYTVHIVDVDPQSWALEPEQLIDHALLDRAGLVIPVACFGKSIEQSRWTGFHQQTNVPVVIDAAASFEYGAENPDTSWGEIPVALSFHATKSFSTGEGGAVATTNVKLAERTQQALNFGFHYSRNSSVPSINGKMSEYHAAIGLAELDNWNEKKSAFHANANRYRDSLRSVGLAERFFGAPDTAAAYAHFLCKDANEAAHIQAQFDKENIGHRFWYGLGLHRNTHFQSSPCDPLLITDTIAPKLLAIPMATDLSKTASDRVVAALIEGVNAAL